MQSKTLDALALRCVRPTAGEWGHRRLRLRSGGFIEGRALSHSPSRCASHPVPKTAEHPPAFALTPGGWSRLPAAYCLLPTDDSSQRNQAAVGAAVDGLGAAGGAELGVDGRDVEFDRVLADLELARDLLVRQALAQELQHLPLARGEAFVGRPA